VCGPKSTDLGAVLRHDHEALNGGDRFIE
jgi:hypothetical protein